MPGANHTASSSMQIESYSLVPEGRRVRLRLFEEFHSSRMGGKFGQETTYLQLCRRFYWPDVDASLRRFVKGCDISAYKVATARSLRAAGSPRHPMGTVEASWH